MKLNSLGLRTSLLFDEFSGDVTTLENLVFIHTPSNPDYFWGNYLIFKDAPIASDALLWTKRFDELFKEADGIKHRSLTWDVTGMREPLSDEVIHAFETLGYSYESHIFHKADKLVSPEHKNDRIKIRPISSEKEWEAMLDLQILCWVGDMDEEEFRIFKTRRVNEYKRMVEAGKGLWFGAFIEERLVGDAGIFRDGEFARYQNVETHPDFRRQGICRTLVYEMGRRVLENSKAEYLVIEAEEDSEAMKIYQSLGFKPIERVEELCMYWD